MQFDDPSRGFSFKHAGPLDMRMNPNRGLSAAEWLERVTPEKLALALYQNADEPQAETLATALAGIHSNPRSISPKPLEMPRARLMQNSPSGEFSKPSGSR